MLHASTQQLIRKLHELTAADALAWTEGENDRSRLETEGYVVEITADPPSLTLLNASGRELERAEAADLVALPWPDGDGTFATRVIEMATQARRVALGTEHAIATILSALSAPPKPSAPHPPPPTSRPEMQNLTPGISARSVQPVEPASPGDLQRYLKPAPQPADPGPSIYKPWA